MIHIQAITLELTPSGLAARIQCVVLYALPIRLCRAALIVVNGRRYRWDKSLPGHDAN
jgi:hypothetical protein